MDKYNFILINKVTKQTRMKANKQRAIGKPARYDMEVSRPISARYDHFIFVCPLNL
jgi:hypothetical protein